MKLAEQQEQGDNDHLPALARRRQRPPEQHRHLISPFVGAEPGATSGAIVLAECVVPVARRGRHKKKSNPPESPIPTMMKEAAQQPRAEAPPPNLPPHLDTCIDSIITLAGGDALSTKDAAALACSMMVSALGLGDVASQLVGVV